MFACLFVFCADVYWCVYVCLSVCVCLPRIVRAHMYCQCMSIYIIMYLCIKYVCHACSECLPNFCTLYNVVCIYVCMYVCMYVRMYVCMNACMICRCIIQHTYRPICVC